MSTETTNTDTPPLELHLAATMEAIERLYTANGSPKPICKRPSSDFRTPDVFTLLIEHLERCVEPRSTGFPWLDIFTTGLIPEQVTVIASSPSAGKTTLAINIAEHVAVDQGVPVGFFSLGCCAAQLVQRMLFSRAQVVPQRIINGYMGKDEVTRLTAACTDLQRSMIFIEDHAELGLQELRVGVKHLVEQQGVGLIVIDHLDLMGATWKTGENRQKEITEISSGIKTLAVEFKIPILVLADLAKGLENRVSDHLQNFTDPQLSAPIARFADVVCFLERKDGYFKPAAGENQDEVVLEEAKSPEPAKRAPTTVSIAKNRNGLLGDASLVFLSEIGRFESWQPGNSQ